MEVVMSEDKINPNHYKGNGGLQVIDAIEIFELNFSRGNAVKYIARAGKKSEQGYDALTKEIEDLEKAAWYIDREVNRIKDLRDAVN
jgi:CRISPR/Cas system-associated protein Cas5 (RAMP superfamily)